MSTEAKVGAVTVMSSWVSVQTVCLNDRKLCTEGGKRKEKEKGIARHLQCFFNKLGFSTIQLSHTGKKEKEKSGQHK